MAYIAAAAFREGSKQWYTAQATLTEEQASTADITAAIASFSAQFDSWTNDHFEATASTEFAIDVRDPGRNLYLPRRVRSVTQVETIDVDGVATVEPATSYRIHSSLNAAGSEAKGDLDWVELLPGEILNTDSGGWPWGTGTVQVTGDWDYLVTPDRVKRAVALLVWNHFAPRGDSLHRAQRWQTEQASYDASQTTPSGLPEVDAIIEDIRRP